MVSPRGLRQGSVQPPLTAGIATRRRARAALPPARGWQRAENPFLQSVRGVPQGPHGARPAQGGAKRSDARTPAARCKRRGLGRGGVGRGRGRGFPAQPAPIGRRPSSPAPPSAPRPRAARSPPAAAAGPDGEHVGGDRRLSAHHLRLGAGVLHAAHRLLEGVFHRRHGHHHRHLLGQPLEDLRDRLHRRFQLQGFPVHAGSRRSEPSAFRPGSPGPGTAVRACAAIARWGERGASRDRVGAQRLG